eukprot:gene44115-53930_t
MLKRFWLWLGRLLGKLLLILLVVGLLGWGIGSLYYGWKFSGPVSADEQIPPNEASDAKAIMESAVRVVEQHRDNTRVMRDAHAKDALQVATRVMQEVVAIGNRYAPHGRGTVGMVNVHPNSRNVIPGRVKFSMDLRNSTDALVDQMDADIRAYAAQVAAETGLKIEVELVSHYPAQPFHADCVNAVQRAAERLGYSHMPAVSGAGHDAVYMAKLAPTGMIFIPCKDGISHNEIEDAKPEHITAGCNVLLQAMLERAG